MPRRLGHGDEEHQYTPKLVEALKGERVCAVAAGEVHSLAITASGSVYSWGLGLRGRYISPALPSLVS